MKVTPIGNDALQMTFLGFSNCYLLRESDGLTAIDCSIRKRGKAIMQTARDFGGTIRRVLLTHAHGDHMGSLDELRDLLGHVDVAISEREAPLLHKDLSLRPGEPTGKPKGGFPGAKTRPTHTLTEGELFGSLRCIYTPGHTPGHMSFLDERSGMLFAGDAMVSMGGLRAVTDTPWWFPFPKGATWDKPLARESVRKLAPLPVRSVATGHGKFIPNGAAAMREAVARVSAR